MVWFDHDQATVDESGSSLHVDQPRIHPRAAASPGGFAGSSASGVDDRASRSDPAGGRGLWASAAGGVCAAVAAADGEARLMFADVVLDLDIGLRLEALSGVWSFSLMG